MIPVIVLALFGLIIGAVICARYWTQHNTSQRLYKRRETLYERLFPKKLAAVGLLIAVSGVALLSVNMVGWPALVAIIESGLTLIAMAWFIFHSRRGRFRDDVLLHGRKICANCLYALDGHGLTGTCPECGMPFTPLSLRQDWM